MDVDMDDLVLINALQIAPRISWTDVGAVLNRHPSTLAGRWSRLRASGTAWVTAHLVGSPDRMALTLHEVACPREYRSEAAAQLCSIPEVVSVDEIAGDRNFALTVITEDWAELTGHTLPRLERIPGLSRFRTEMATELYSGGNDWRLDVLDPAQQWKLQEAAKLSGVRPGRLPVGYWPMVRSLTADGRAGAVELASASEQHPSTVRRQLARVLGSGTLSFRCEMAQTFSGAPITCQWRVAVPATDRARAAEFLRGRRNLRFCAATTGAANFRFIFWLQDAAAIAALENAFLTAIPEAVIRESMLTVRSLKRVGWMLTENGSTTGEVVVPEDAGVQHH